MKWNEENRTNENVINILVFYAFRTSLAFLSLHLPYFITYPQMSSNLNTLALLLEKKSVHSLCRKKGYPFLEKKKKSQ